MLGSIVRAIALHRPHSLERVAADRRLLGEHHSRRSVEDRVRHVARLCARRLGVADHRLEHLGCGDHGLSPLERVEDDPLLEERHDLDADLDAQVAAGDHDRVRLLEDRGQRVDRLRLLDLGDHVGVDAGLLDQLLEVADVGGRAHERERDEVDAEPECELEVVRVLSSQGRNRHRNARNVHALVRGDGPADDDCAACASRLDGLDAKPDEPVVDQDVVAGLEHLADHRRQDGQLSVHASVLASRDDDLVAVGEQHRRLELADAELRAPGGRRSARPAGPTSSCAFRTMRAYSACCSCVPCEKLRRAPSIPACASAITRSSVAHDGPSVTTIFVRRGTAVAICVSVARAGSTVRSSSSRPRPRSRTRRGDPGLTTS